jgi:hypothetical protein
MKALRASVVEAGTYSCLGRYPVSNSASIAGLRVQNRGPNVDRMCRSLKPLPISMAIIASAFSLKATEEKKARLDLQARVFFGETFAASEVRYDAPLTDETLNVVLVC